MSRRARCFNSEKFVTHATSENGHILDKFIATDGTICPFFKPSFPLTFSRQDCIMQSCIDTWHVSMKAFIEDSYRASAEHPASLVCCGA